MTAMRQKIRKHMVLAVLKILFDSRRLTQTTNASRAFKDPLDIENSEIFQRVIASPEAAKWSVLLVFAINPSVITSTDIDNRLHAKLLEETIAIFFSHPKGVLETRSGSKRVGSLS